MSKYIIKNCPATGAGCCGDTCPEITDCPLKQIVEKCRNVECNCIVDKNKCSMMDNMPLCCDVWKSKDILRLLDIQEVE